MKFAEKPDFEGVFGVHAQGAGIIPAAVLTSDDLSQYCYSVLTVSDGADWMVVKMRRAAFELYWQVADYLPERYEAAEGAWRAVAVLSVQQASEATREAAPLELASKVSNRKEDDTSAAQMADIIKQAPRKRRNISQVSL